jgi:hypothetical protein
VLRAFQSDGKGWQRVRVSRGTSLDGWMSNHLER